MQKRFLPLCLFAAVILAGCKMKDAATDTAQPAATDSATTTPVPVMAQPDAQMKVVLDQLATMGGKPIETLTATEARQQPTPTDAVIAVMKAQGKPTTPDAAVTSVDRNIALPTGSLPARS